MPSKAQELEARIRELINCGREVAEHLPSNMRDDAQRTEHLAWERAVIKARVSLGELGVGALLIDGARDTSTPVAASE